MKLLIIFLIASIVFCEKGLAQALTKKDSLTYDTIGQQQKAALIKLKPESLRPYFDKKQMRQTYATLLKELQEKDPDQQKNMTVDKLMAHDSMRPIYSKYQDRISYATVGDVVDQIISAKTALNIYGGSTFPKYATELSTEVNSSARIINGEYVLFINYRAMIFCWEMAKLINMATEFHTEGGKFDFTYDLEPLKENIKKDLGIKKRFLELVNAFYNGALYSQELTDALHTRFYSALTNSMEIFLISHEYMHSYYKHDLNSLYGKINTGTEENRKKRLINSWRNEIMADNGAQDLLNQYVDQKELPELSLYDKTGGILLLAALNVLEKAGYILENKTATPKLDRTDPVFVELVNNIDPSRPININSDKIGKKWLLMDHPPLELRLMLVTDNVQRYIQQRINEGKVDDVQLGFFKLAYNYSLAYDFLLEQCQDDIIKMAN